MIGVDNLRKVPVKVPYKSGFDKSFRNSFTGTTGTLIPVLCDELMPNQDTFIRMPFVVRLPPLASDTFMNVEYKLEAFFVPTRILMASNSYEKFMSGMTDLTYSGNTTKLRTPVIKLYNSVAPSSSLADYLGYHINYTGAVSGPTEFNATAFPFLCYALIWDEWYRNSLVQQSLFTDEITSAYGASSMKVAIPAEDASIGYSISYGSNDQFADGSSIFDLRQRNFPCDYFTVSTPTAQNGPVMGVKLELDVDKFASLADEIVNAGDAGDPASYTPSLLETVITNKGKQQWFGNNPPHVDSTFEEQGVTANEQGSPYKYGGFTIASLRAANSIQIFLERNRLSGNRFVDFLKANYGADLSDGIAQRPVYLGSASFPVYTSGVMANGAPDGAANNSNNPFETVGASYGNAYAEGSDFVVKFHNDEPGYLMVLGSLVPEASYSSGIERYLMRYVRPDSRTDMANHLLQNVGPQPIYFAEASSGMVLNVNDTSVFGYSDRYSDWMTKRNQVHGLFHDGESLQSFALQRSLTNPSINSSFLTIPTNYLDQVMAVTNAEAGFSYWADFYIEYKCSMPLARYSIPSLQDPAYEHGDTIWLNRGGVRIS